MAKIKLCGLSRPEDIAAVNQALPDYIGFVFAPGRRQISAANAQKLKHMLSPSIQAVGVFVNAPVAEILDIAAKGVIDIIQLHGDEDPGTIQFLKDTAHLPIIKAIRMRSEEDICAAKTLPCDYLLLDTYVSGLYGGSGKRFDWSLIPSLHHPYFLAGGLDLSNLSEAAETGAFCLDVSSAAETDGAKDPAKIIDIIKKVRSV